MIGWRLWTYLFVLKLNHDVPFGVFKHGGPLGSPQTWGFSGSFIMENASKKTYNVINVQLNVIGFEMPAKKHTMSSLAG